MNRKSVRSGLQSLQNIIIIGALIVSNVILYSKIEQGTLIKLEFAVKVPYYSLVLLCCFVSTLPLFAYQCFIESIMTLYKDPDYGHLIFIAYRLAIQTLLQKNIIFIFCLLPCANFELIPGKLITLTLVFILGEAAYILGNILSIYLNYQPLNYPGIAFTYSSCFYLLIYNLSKFK